MKCKCRILWQYTEAPGLLGVLQMMPAWKYDVQVGSCLCKIGGQGQQNIWAEWKARCTFLFTLWDTSFCPLSLIINILVLFILNKVGPPILCFSRQRRVSLSWSRLCETKRTTSYMFSDWNGKKPPRYKTHPESVSKVFTTIHPNNLFAEACRPQQFYFMACG